VAGFCEYGNEPAGSVATELVMAYTVCGQNAEFLIIKVGGTYSYRQAFMG
jgi:hypothetical protein